MNELITILEKSEIFNKCISFLVDSDISNWFICAGFIQQIYFNYRHGYELHENINDVDIAYFNPMDLSEETEQKLEAEINSIIGHRNIVADVKNQARVHLWYKAKFGYEVKPYRDIFDAIDSFPTTTTTIGVRKNKNNQYFIYSSYGLDDLFNLIHRANKVKITKEIYDKKKSKISKYWNKVKIVEW